mmetsp:Transcript_101422/g.295513  ORF Transcript_101422/g.295513 Transcript_101422/m.295513 type:complete len:280 (-) Transcript_101422:149-988(-)
MTQEGEEAVRLPTEAATGVEVPVAGKTQQTDARVVPTSGLRESADLLASPLAKSQAEAAEVEATAKALANALTEPRSECPNTTEEANAEVEVDAFADADFARESSSDGDSSDSFDGPPLDAYWSSMLNVTKTAEPLQPPKMMNSKEDGAPRDRGRGGKGASGDGRPAGKGDGKGKAARGGKPGMFYMAPMHPLAPLAPMAFFAAAGKGPGGVDGNPMGDPGAEQGSRQRSRSPHGRASSDDLRNFLSASRDESAANEESLEDRKAQDDKINDSIRSFLA